LAAPKTPIIGRIDAFGRLRFDRDYGQGKEGCSHDSKGTATAVEGGATATTAH